jgi:hypothetical protein
MDLTTIKIKLEYIRDKLHISDHYSALSECENINDAIKDILQPHWDIQSSDEQYSDPEMWDYEPIYHDLQRPLDLLYFIDQWFMSEEGYEESDVESINKAREIIEKIIDDMES